MATKRKKRPPAALTPSERYLLRVIARLRGSACDAWARLNFIVTRRKFARDGKGVSLLAALVAHADPAEIRACERWLHAEASGAGLPPVTRHIPAEFRQEVVRTFRRRVRRGYAAAAHEVEE